MNEYNPNLGADFDLESEFKETPLIPQGRYHATVTKAQVDSDAQTINFTFCLKDNGGVMSDGETPVDGATVTHKVWMPRAGDENELTSDGRQTKRQAKINMIGRFAVDLGRPREEFKSRETIQQHCVDGDWLGLEVDLAIGLREYEGRIFNEIKKFYKLK